MIKHIYIGLHARKVPVILVRFQWDLNFLEKFSNNFQISNVIKICPSVPSCSLCTDRRRDGQTWRS